MLAREQNEIDVAKKPISFIYSRDSDAIIKMADETQHVYERSKLIGAGSFGNVYLMKPKNNVSLPLFVIKEITLAIETGRCMLALEKEVRKTHKIAKHEKKMYRVISEKDNGFALLHQTNEPLEARKNYQSIFYATSYKRNYILMDYIDKPLFKEVKVKSQNDFFDLFSALLKALQLIHDKEILHGDIKAGNIFVWKDEEGHYHVRFIDMSISLKFGEQVGVVKYLTRENSLQFPPEYFNKSTPVYAHPNQDIFSLGKLLKPLLEQSIKLTSFADYLKQEIILLLSEMTHQNPDKRPTLECLIEKAEILKKKTALLLEEKEVIAYLNQANEKALISLREKIEIAEYAADLSYNRLVIESALKKMSLRALPAECMTDLGLGVVGLYAEQDHRRRLSAKEEINHLLERVIDREQSLLSKITNKTKS